MSGSREGVTSATKAEAAAGVARPAWFLEIEWPDFSTRLCTYGEVTWNSLVWAGGGFVIAGFERDRPTRITLIDPNDAYRTLVLSQGLRDRAVRLWNGYIDALADDDPVPIFDGFANGFNIANGRVTFDLDWQASSRAFTPREWVGPPIGVNWTAIPGTTITWGDTVIKFEARPRG